MELGYMRYKLDTTYSASEIVALISDKVDHSVSWVNRPEDKLFLVHDTPDGFILARKHKAEKIGTYYFKISVKDDKEGKPELIIRWFPSLIHFVMLGIFIVIIIGRDHRTPVLNDPGFKIAIIIVIASIVLIPNIIEFIKIKKELISTIILKES